jgi:acetolactate decarboxylase
MSVDPKLVAATTLRTAHGLDHADRPDHEVVHQLQLAHVLLDGGYEGVATLAEVLADGDQGLGTVDRLDGELVIVDGQPWQIDWHGHAHLMPPETTTPFAVVAHLDPVATVRLVDADFAAVRTQVEHLVDDPTAVVAVRLEGEFDHALMRSVPPQDPPYRPFAEVSDSEVRWDVAPFIGVMVGFRFPDLSPGATIAGLHLHGIDQARTTGGHVYDFHVRKAVLTLGVSHQVTAHLPHRSAHDLLETPHDQRMVLQMLQEGGPLAVSQISDRLAIDPVQAEQRVQWLADRGFVEAVEDPEVGTLWRSIVEGASA